MECSHSNFFFPSRGEDLKNNLIVAKTSEPVLGFGKLSIVVGDEVRRGVVVGGDERLGERRGLGKVVLQARDCLLHLPVSRGNLNLSPPMIPFQHRFSKICCEILQHGIIDL